MSTKLNSSAANNPLISVIVPVYNAEDYLAATIRSIQEQTYRNIEIILINDGSTDHSPQICDEMASADNRIVVIHQINKGISQTRNTGLDEAKGEYIAFCDNDDFIHPQMLELLYNAITQTNTELSMCQTATTSCANEIKVSHLPSPTESTILSSDDLMTELFNCSSPTMHLNTNCIWNKLYHRDLIEKIRFKDKGYEDTSFCLSVYLKRLRCAFINIPLYYWIIRGTSASHCSAFNQYKYQGLYSHYINYLTLRKHNVSEKIQGYCLLRLYKTLLNGRFYSQGTPFENKTIRVLKYINKIVHTEFYSNKYISAKEKLAIFMFFHFRVLHSAFLRSAPYLLKYIQR